GSFTYNSIADLTANRPSSFSRTLTSPKRTGGEVTGAFAVADNWSPSQRFSMVYGARAEGNAFTRARSDNPEIEQLFGARKAAVPNRWHVSPRVGFNWLYTSARPSMGMSSGL